MSFLRSSFVRVKEDWGGSFDGIIDGTYLQMFGAAIPDADKDYSIWVVQGGMVINRRAWIKEDNITLLPGAQQNQYTAEAMIDKYQRR